MPAPAISVNTTRLAIIRVSYSLFSSIASPQELTCFPCKPTQRPERYPSNAPALNRPEFQPGLVGSQPPKSLRPAPGEPIQFLPCESLLVKLGHPSRERTSQCASARSNPASAAQDRKS